jgi:ketosteroid isomerase-like protein
VVVEGEPGIFPDPVARIMRALSRPFRRERDKPTSNHEEAQVSDNVSWVGGLYDAFAKGDIPTVLAALDPKVEWNEAEHVTFWPGSAFIGPEAVVEGVFMRIPETFGDTFRINVDRILDCGDAVLVEARYTGTVQSTGKEISAQVAHVWDIAGGKIVRFQQYTDTWQFAEATGIAPVTD